MLGIEVSDNPMGFIELTVGNGVEFTQYDTKQIKTDEKGIARSDGQGPDIAWFEDPSGNIISVIEADPNAAE